MPLLFSRHPFPNATFSLWQIAEGEDFFRKDLPLSDSEETELALLKGLRRLEWLAARWLLDKMSRTPKRLPLAKDGFSKPFFPDNENLICSLSHSHGVVGALLLELDESASEQPGAYGCDIQVLVEKMNKIAPKFINQGEFAQMEAIPAAKHFDVLHVFWTAKESLYKAYGLKSLDFRSHIFVQNLEWDGTIGLSTGLIKKDNYEQAFELYSEKIQLPEGNEHLIWTICRPQNA